jgi:hypothetical protein
MDGEAIMTISAAVVALTQIVKWGGVPDKYGPVAVVLLSALGVVLWAYSKGAIHRELVWAYFAGGTAVATSAAGVFGFTRAGAEAVSRMTPPPGSGAGSSPTVKE